MALMDIPENIAREKARVQDEVVNTMLDKHLLKGMTKEELELNGYYLVQTHGEDPFQEYVTFKLLKLIDTTSYKFKVRIDYEDMSAKKEKKPLK